MFLPYKKLTILTLIVLLSSCASYGVIKNQPLKSEPKAEYSIRSSIGQGQHNEVSIFLSFSGGGSRASALAYGVLQGLRDAKINVNGESRNLLEEVDAISSVSGGSFTAAYYGLYGDKIFEDYESRFLRRDITGELIHSLFNPFSWFTSTGRTETATQFYEKNIFEGATFSDLNREGAPLIIINATDLISGTRFSFLQEYFDLLCSDISNFPIAKAVTASSAVPILFNPVMLRNYEECQPSQINFLNNEKISVGNDARIKPLIKAKEHYKNKVKNPFIHLVDGGVTDNLGLLSLYEFIELSGGFVNINKQYKTKPNKHFIVISVNASTTPETAIGTSNKVPSIEDTMNAVSDIQIHRYNELTTELIEKSLDKWTKDIAKQTGTTINSYFIQLDFEAVKHKKDKLFLNSIPTSFYLDAKQTEELIRVGKELLYKNEKFLYFMRNVN